MALARLSLLKSGALLGQTTTDFDNELKRLLEAATEFAHQFTGRELESATYTDERYTGDGGRKLYPRQWPVTTLSAVKIWDGTDSYDTETSTYYELIDQRYIRYPALGQEGNSSYGGWPKWADGIKLTYTAGYATTGWDSAAITASFAVPRDLEYAVAKIAALAWMEGKKGGARLGMQSMSKSAETLIVERFVSGIPDDVKHTLHQYRRLT